MRLRVPDSPARHAPAAERGPHSTLRLTRAHVRRLTYVYGAHGNDAVAAVLAYQAVALLVPLAGGTIAFLLLRGALSPASRTVDGTA